MEPLLILFFAWAKISVKLGNLRKDQDQTDSYAHTTSEVYATGPEKCTL
jgi:hypothetical protein